jgi:ferritin-like metal-binding protein YciE
MALTTVRDLFVAELSDLYDAEHQVLFELPLLSAGATSDQLRAIFDQHYRDTHQHVARLETLFRRLDERPRLGPCRALRGIIEDARTRHGALERGPALDAALISAAQRIEHYEIAAYRCARTYALSLADALGAELLQQTLDEEGGMDQRLCDLAQVGGLAAATPARILTH